MPERHSTLDGRQTEEKCLVHLRGPRCTLGPDPPTRTPGDPCTLSAHAHRQSESTPVLACDGRSDEGPSLKGLQLLVPRSFENGDIDVEIHDLLIDGALVLFEAGALEL